MTAPDWRAALLERYPAHNVADGEEPIDHEHTPGDCDECGSREGCDGDHDGACPHGCSECEYTHPCGDCGHDPDCDHEYTCTECGDSCDGP